MLIITFYMIEMGNIFLHLEDYFLAKFSIEITAYSLIVKDLGAAWDAPHPRPPSPVQLFNL